MHGAHSQTPSSTSLTHSLIHFPQGKAARAKAWAAFSVARERGFQNLSACGWFFPGKAGKGPGSSLRGRCRTFSGKEKGCAKKACLGGRGEHPKFREDLTGKKGFSRFLDRGQTGRVPPREEKTTVFHRWAGSWAVRRGVSHETFSEDFLPIPPIL